MKPTESRVLLIDDDVEDFLLVQDLLEEASATIELVHASSGDEGLARLRDEPFDALLVDYRLGAEDGLVVMKEADRAGFEGPIILLTGQDDFELGRNALREGATDYLVKGLFTGDGLARSIRYAMERRGLERKLRQFNSELEVRVRERTAELEQATRELEGFTYSASHDLRTPLRAIMGTSRILAEDYREALPEDARMLLDRQASAARHLGQLIDDLLELSRIGRSELHKVPIDLTQMFMEVAPTVSDRLALTIEEGITVNGDPRLVRLTVQNLLENSAKFVLPGRDPHVTVTQDLVNGAPSVIVEDDGPGFDQQYESKIWEPFQRLVRDEDYPGTGIGLANVKRIVDRHNGKIRAEGRLGQGARFILTLPS